MNKLIKLGCIALAGTLLFSCETDPEKLEIVKPYPKSDQYYADLRDYKNSDHEIVFGWFGNWSATGASASNYMKSLPDSIDMVGLWGGWQTITEAQRKDMEDSQHKRGLKVIATSLFDGFEMGVAQWQPIIEGEKVMKGGCGTYHMEYEYRNPEPYKFLIEAIQIQNPARK